MYIGSSFGQHAYPMMNFINHVYVHIMCIIMYLLQGQLEEAALRLANLPHTDPRV